ncbi:hypothetical protein KSX_89850 [Ktedonospora formicarum]|uniref:DNA-directed RNA polymerase n=1 Tax=Ktedonospora formicarum TaxID=2778364 RepID=A0A8J3I5Q9_9CHLR|nr:hypothetical protein KSX_89850 [Ktedonospora formicarum]
MRFDAMKTLTIGLASPDMIRQWSHGEVQKPETINYQTQQPEEDGLFCQRIFGPTRDWSCACGKYQRIRTPGVICKHCGVALAPASVRRSRMGHIELAVPIAHPWYVRNHTIERLLGLTSRQLRALLDYQCYLVLSINEEKCGKSTLPEKASEQERTLHRLLLTLKPGDLLEAEHYHAHASRFPDHVYMKTGAEAVCNLLQSLDLDALAGQLREALQSSETQDPKVLKRLHVVEAFRASGQNPAWMILSALPVLPPELRPVLLLDGGRIASSDLNDLYCRVLHRNTRLHHFLQHHAQKPCSIMSAAYSKKPAPPFSIMRMHTNSSLLHTTTR